ARPEGGAIEYTVTPLSFEGESTIEPYLDGEVVNEDANYDEKFWTPVDPQTFKNGGLLTAETKKLGFHVCAGMHCSFLQNGEPVAYNGKAAASPTKISQKYTITAGEEDTITLHKYVVIASSLNHERKRLHPVVEDQLEELTQVGFSA